ncbi:hypothetical protein [Bacillus sp. 165]|uniref:hypothetical protein n=1 Tax=Bacillus sp. 165 TaxID=1529117 RepID=UPI001FFE051C|nr:hypothetical protein [Bacillus sp. 165]
MKKYVLATMIALILFKALSCDTAKAETEQAPKAMQIRIEEHYRQKAEELGIQAEGKDLKQVRKEIHIVKERKRQEYIIREAQKFHVHINGKSWKELAEEIRQVKEEEQLYISEAAEQVGINTRGKTTKRLLEEIERLQEEINKH